MKLLNRLLDSGIGMAFSDAIQRSSRYHWNLIYGEKEIPMVRHLCDRDRDSIDVGANVGNYSCVMRRFSRRVIAVEPVPWEASKLRRGQPDLTVHCLALSNLNGCATLRIPCVDGKFTTALASVAAGGPEDVSDWRFQVDARTLDTLYDGDVGFIKIDVEGHEEAVLRGADETLRRCRPKLLVEIEERHNPGALARIEKFFAELDYVAFFAHDGRLRRLGEFDLALQDPHAVEDFPFGRIPQRFCRYVNNFIFLPREAAPTTLARLGREVGIRRRSWNSAGAVPVEAA